MSREGRALEEPTTDETPSEDGRETPLTQYQLPMVSPSSVESIASVETVRPTNTAAGRLSLLSRLEIVLSLLTSIV